MSTIHYISLLSFISAFVGGLFLNYIFLFLLKKFQFLDFPKKYRLKRRAVAYPLGISFLIGSFGLLFFSERFHVLGIFLAILGGISFWDDRKNLSAFFRLNIHILLGAFLVYSGISIEFIGDPFHDTNFNLLEFSPIITAVVTILWIVILQNALNWFDGTAGLTPAISGIGFLILGLLGLWKPELFFDPAHTDVTWANFYLSGLSLSMVYILYKQEAVLGDTGSQIMGSLLAIMSIIAGAKIATTILVLILPILDFVFIIFRRIFLDKVSPFSGDKKHLHHQMQDQIGSGKTLIILSTFSLLFGTVAVIFSGIFKFYALLLLVVLLLIWRIKIHKELDTN